MNTSRRLQRLLTAPILAGLLALLGSCALIPRPEYALPSAELERVRPGLTVAEVDRVLGAPASVELIDAHTQRHVYLFDSIQTTSQSEPDSALSTYAKVSVICRDGVAVDKSVEHAERRKPYHSIGKPRSSRKHSPSKAQLGWRAKFVAHADSAAREASVTGMWRIAPPHSKQGYPMVPTDVAPNWLIVADADRMYLEPATQFVAMKASWFSGSRSTAEGQPRTWLLEGEGGSFDRWDVRLSFDPKLQSVEAHWVEPYHSKGKGILFDLGSKLLEDATSSAIVTAGQRIVSTDASRASAAASAPLTSAAN